MVNSLDQLTVHTELVDKWSLGECNGQQIAQTCWISTTMRRSEEDNSFEILENSGITLIIVSINNNLYSISRNRG